MLIQKTHKEVSRLSHILPDAFVFAIDTIDRTFLFKKNEKEECVNSIIKLDEDFGIEQLVQASGHAQKKFNAREIGIKQLSPHTFVGFSLREVLVNQKALAKAQSALMDEPFSALSA